MNNKIGIVALALILIAFGWSFKADAVGGYEDSYLFELVGKEVVVVFNSDYPCSGRAAKAKLLEVDAHGVVLILLDDVEESGTVLEWNKENILCPFSAIMSIKPCVEKKWRRYKGFLKKYKQ